MPKLPRAPSRSPAAPPVTCEQVTGLILEYVSEDLDRATTRAFRSHLRECPDCVAFLNTYKKSIRTARSLRYQEIPAELQRRVRAFLTERITPSPRGR